MRVGERRREAAGPPMSVLTKGSAGAITPWARNRASRRGRCQKRARASACNSAWVSPRQMGGGRQRRIPLRQGGDHAVGDVLGCAVAQCARKLGRHRGLKPGPGCGARRRRRPPGRKGVAKLFQGPGSDAPVARCWVNGERQFAARAAVAHRLGVAADDVGGLVGRQRALVCEGGVGLPHEATIGARWDLDRGLRA